MSRSGYYDECDDQWQHIMYRGRVASAIRGKRGQALLRDLAAGMDAMPEKRLIADELWMEGDACALGVVAQKRGLNVNEMDPEDIETVASEFNIADQLAREIVWINDEACPYGRETPEQRWHRVRRWVDAQLKPSPTEDER